MSVRGHDFRQQTVNKIEKNQRRVLASELVALADSLGVSVSDLLGLGSDRAPLLLSGARLEEATRNLQHASLAYARAMLSFALAADAASDLHANDAYFATEPLVKQTPGWIATADVVGSIEATLKNTLSESLGEHASKVLRALKTEHDYFHRETDG
ncbi:hypothetical protein ASF96_02915 [Microbacterium sp. Leaf179]|nr:hypothetical protein ASF96_02915 [Microbacterium sp. Leaf179]